MESNGDRRDRARTVSGPIPDLSTTSNDKTTNTEEMRFPWSSPTTPASPVNLEPSSSTPDRPSTSAGPSPQSIKSGRKRAFSSNILQKINFLRSNAEDGSPSGSSLRPPSREQRPASREKDKPATSPTKSLFSRKSIDDDAPSTSPPKAESGGALAAAMKQNNKTRKRKGSLRKTALLGGRRMDSAGRERKGSFSLLQRSGSVKQHSRQLEQEQEEAIEDDGSIDRLPSPDHAAQPVSRPMVPGRQHSYDSSVATSSSDGDLTEPVAVSAARLSLLTDHPNVTQTGRPAGVDTTVDDLGSPLDLKSPISQASYTSTTDEDELLTFDRPTSKSMPSQPPPTPPLSSVSTSYFPTSLSLSTTSLRRRSTKHRSPLSRSLPLTSTNPTIADTGPHDYTETEYWGWILLVCTWLTFTVGMGSCLEVWSWAWDVGELPYAPPDLEDDESLPIVGYYPALMVLTGVVAWVWITVAWVGMKYFRHAKIEM